ncbi:NAD-dependent epimerase/dehydratase family protein [Micromonospora sp. NPDC049282]|uniref:NAD-dependent epimerase/dehydratase family protein n=1 Tax=Micromonospora sp. NPDC049282 TaxID=3364269 RepID=UPI00371AB8B8
MTRRALVTGAGGFIGSHLVTYLRSRGWWVRGADLKRPEFGDSDADDFVLGDLREPDACRRACEGVTEVYALAADMGGMGFISKDPATILRNNALINLHTIEAARLAGASRYFLASSACVYPEHVQTTPDVRPLRESDAFPAGPQDSYGWEKLMAERLGVYYAEQYGMDVRIARYHNVYGPNGTYDGGREKAPAALCRKVAEAPPGGDVEIWGDGRQTRSFCYVDDCVEGTYRLMRSDHAEPVNIGSDRLVTIDDLAALVMTAAGRDDVRLRHVSGPQGVRGRNSDNTLVHEVLGWTPEIPLEEGLRVTYRWIADQAAARRGVPAQTALA